MHIPGTEPSSVILSQRNLIIKVEKWWPKMPTQAEAKRDGVINQQNYNSIQF